MIKPCTPAEISFYQSCAIDHPDWAAVMPQYMGKLELSDPNSAISSLPQTANQREIKDAIQSLASAAGDRSEAPLAGAGGGMGGGMGRPLETTISIVLENITAGFVRPNVMDIKLGRRTWDENTPPEKRQRLEKVCQNSTSASLGWRISGMKVWRGPPPRASQSSSPPADSDDGYVTHDKHFARTTTAASIREEGLIPFLDPTGRDRQKAAELAAAFAKSLARIRGVVAAAESRMIGASVLFVYEGDEVALERAWAAEREGGSRAVVEGGHEGHGDEDEGEEVVRPKVADVRLIDFAHARWVPGEGADENVLFGLETLEKAFSEMGKLRSVAGGQKSK